MTFYLKTSGLLMSLMAMIARLRGSGLLEREVAIETGGDRVSHYVCQVFNCRFAHSKTGQHIMLVPL
jgi:hypothetical protein